MQDLVPQAVDRQNQPRKHQNRIPSTMKAYSNKEVHRLADFRNLPVLNEFVSEGGQIVSRQKSKLQSKVHRHLARQIKTARVMALLPHAGMVHTARSALRLLTQVGFQLCWVVWVPLARFGCCSCKQAFTIPIWVCQVHGKTLNQLANIRLHACEF